IAGELKLKEKITLARGDNLIEIVAANQDALTGYETFETTRLPVLVTYSAKAVELTLSKLTASNSNGSPTQWEINPGQPQTVETAKVRIQGKVKAKDNLAQLSWRKANDKQQQPATGFTANKVKEFAIDQEVTLSPGAQQVQFTARTTAGD